MTINARNWHKRSGWLIAAGLLMLLVSGSVGAETRITLSMRDTSLSDVMNMLARQNRVNILLADNVESDVSFNLYDVTLDEAIRSIARAAGFMVERQKNTYFVIPENQAGKAPGGGFTIMKSIPVQYADPVQLESKLGDYLSDFGNITALPDRKLLVIEDQPGFVYRISQLVTELDKRPLQVLIEAKIFEIKLNDEQSFGIDWQGLFTSGDGSGDFGVDGLLTPGNSGNAGFFFNYLEPNIEASLRALESDGRVRNLASPKVVTVVNEEAEVIIGDRRGYRVTTTINQVTTESIEFLESGTILRVTPTIDQNGQILLNIHPEVSTGIVDENGIPSQTTTEVTTRLLVSSGQSIFIGGLMRNTTTEGRTGVPLLGRIPGVRWLFSSKSRTTVNTETVVIITPRLLDDTVVALNDESLREFEREQREMEDHASAVDESLEETFRKREPKQPSDADVDADSDGVLPTGQLTTATEAEGPVGGVGPSVSPARAEKSPAASSIVQPPIAEPARARPTTTRSSLENDAADTETGIDSASAVDAPTVSPQGPGAEPETAVAQAVEIAGRYAINLHSDLAPIDFDQTATDPKAEQLLYLSETEIDGNTWYRLRLGFFATEAEGQTELEQWLDEFPAAWMVRVGPKERADAPGQALAGPDPVLAQSD